MLYYIPYSLGLSCLFLSGFDANIREDKGFLRRHRCPHGLQNVVGDIDCFTHGLKVVLAPDENEQAVSQDPRDGSNGIDGYRPRPKQKSDEHHR